MIKFLQYFAAQGDPCTPPDPGFFDFPTWYKYLPFKEDGLGKCSSVSLEGVDKGYLLIGFAVLEILLRVATLVAVGFIIAGGVKYITSSGMPDKEAQARATAINALIGLVVAVASGAVVSFIAGRF